MKNITYLIGAGASFHSLPLIKTMNLRMRAYSTFLKVQKEKNSIKHNFIDTFIKDFDYLIEIESERTSIDAYAKELYLRGETHSNLELVRLKTLLSSFFIFEQLAKPNDLIFLSDELDLSILPHSRYALKDEIQKDIKRTVDKRYPTFWGTYLDIPTGRLPDNIKIISWNYDMQFESSYSSIKDYSLELTQQNLQVYPSPLITIDLAKSCILKLNGTAGLYNDGTSKKLFNHFDFREHTLMTNLDYLIEPYAQNYHRVFSRPLFSFAWETDSIPVQTREWAKKIIEETEILVIIGYSFPDFNRTVDRKIFSSIPKLSKVYYQIPKEEQSELIDGLDSINPELQKITKPINNLSTFYIPNEH